MAGAVMGILGMVVGAVFRLQRYLLWTLPMQFWTRHWQTNRSNLWWACMLAPGVLVMGLLCFFWLLMLLPEIGLFKPFFLFGNYLALYLAKFVLAASEFKWKIFGHGTLSGLFVAGLSMTVFTGLFCSPVYLAIVVFRDYMTNPSGSWRDRGPKVLSTFGTARFGTPLEQKRDAAAGSTGPGSAFLMGRSTGGRKELYTLTSHVLTCAPTGAGKGIGCVLPNLLTYRGSVFCLDVKGENYRKTVYARRAMGQKTNLFDPFGVVSGPGPKVAVNWLSALDTSKEDCISAAASVAEAIVVRDPRVDSHWDDAASNLLQGLVLYAAHLGELDAEDDFLSEVERPTKVGHIGDIRRWLTLPEAELTAFLEQVAKEQHIAFAVPSRAANSFLAKADRERSGVLSTALRHTAFLDDPRVVRALGGDKSLPDVSFDSLKNNTETFYLVVPPDKMTTYSRLARVTLSLAMQAMVQTPSQQGQLDVLFLLDEFAQLGYFPPAEEGLSILRGYNAALWFLVQDLGQLKAIYPKWRSFLANAHLQAFGTQDLETAKYISDLLGQTTVRIQTTTHSHSSSLSGDGGSSSYGHQEVQRPLKTPDEVRRLGAEQVVLFERGKVPFLLQRLDVRSGDGLPKGAKWGQERSVTFVAAANEDGESAQGSATTETQVKRAAASPGGAA